MAKHGLGACFLAIAVGCTMFYVGLYTAQHHPTDLAVTEKAATDESVIEQIDTSKDIPEWVRKQYEEYKIRKKEKISYERPFGWGTGTYKDRRFEWFAYTNTDAWLQFGLSTTIGDPEIDKIRAHKDGYGHEGEVNTTSCSIGKLDSVPLGGTTWIGFTSSWTYKHCRGERCNIGTALEEAVADLNRTAGPNLKLTVAGKFEW